MTGSGSGNDGRLYLAGAREKWRVYIAAMEMEVYCTLFFLVGFLESSGIAIISPSPSHIPHHKP